MVEIFSSGGMRIERTPAAHLMRAALTPAADAVLPDDFPRPVPLQAVRVGQGTGWWIGPRQYLVRMPPPKREELARAMADRDALLSPLDGAYEWLVITGPVAPALMACGCALDLHDRVCPADFTTRTLFAELPVLLHKLSGAPTPAFALLIDCSRADALAEWLDVTARGLSRTPALKVE